MCYAGGNAVVAPIARHHPGTSTQNTIQQQTNPHHRQENSSSSSRIFFRKIEEVSEKYSGELHGLLRLVVSGVDSAIYWWNDYDGME